MKQAYVSVSILDADTLAVLLDDDRENYEAAMATADAERVQHMEDDWRRAETVVRAHTTEDAQDPYYTTLVDELTYWLVIGDCDCPYGTDREFWDAIVRDYKKGAN